MKNIIKSLICLMCLLPISSCEDFVPFDRVYSFWVENKSDESISFLVSYNYPDTIIPDNYNELKGVMPGSKSPYDSDEKWEDVFKSLPSDTLSIFIFRAKTISYYDWQLIRNNYKILKRYDISLGDLKQKKWIIPYP